jgi:hypothetical protein
MDEKLYRVNFGPLTVSPLFMSFTEWYSKRVMSRDEYKRLEALGKLDPMGVYVITDCN